MTIALTGALVAEEIISVLETAQKLTGTGGADATEALAALDSILSSVISGLKGDIDSATVMANVESVKLALQSDDNKADAAPAGTKE